MLFSSNIMYTEKDRIRLCLSSEIITPIRCVTAKGEVVLASKINLTIDEQAHQSYTPNEKWEINTLDYDHPYMMAASFTLSSLDEGKGRNCLVIGSPLFEAILLKDAGWEVVYLDCRTPPNILPNIVIADATSIPFPDNSFDSVATSCVLCHAGLGRYNDILAGNGDEKMLKEIFRVAKPNTIIIINPGSTYPWLAKTIVTGSIHRIYALSSILSLIESVGFKILGIAVSMNSKWLTEDEFNNLKIIYEGGVILERPYLSMKLQKVG